jgi:hypothetical protein
MNGCTAVAVANTDDESIRPNCYNTHKCFDAIFPEIGS